MAPDEDMGKGLGQRHSPNIHAKNVYVCRKDSKAGSARNPTFQRTAQRNNMIHVTIMHGDWTDAKARGERGKPAPDLFAECPW